MFLCVDPGYGMHVEVSDNLRMSVFSSRHMGTVNQTRDSRLGGNCLYPPDNLASPGMLSIPLVGRHGEECGCKCSQS